MISNPLVYDKNEVVLKSEVALMRERWLSGRHHVTRCGRPALGSLPARTREDRTTVSARGCEARRGCRSGPGGLPPAGQAGHSFLPRRGRLFHQQRQTLPRSPAVPQPRGGAAAVCSTQGPPPPAEPRPRVRGGRRDPPTKSGLHAASSPRPGRRRGQAGTGLQCALSSLACCEAASCTLLAYEITDSAVNLR